MHGTRKPVSLIVLLAGAAALSGCGYIPGSEQNNIEKGKKAVAKLLRDGESARYEDLKSYQVKSAAGDDIAVCGMVNGRNAHGAYAGFVKFAALLSDQSAAIDPETGITKRDMNAAVKGCERAAKTDDMGIGLAQFECEQAKEKLEQWREQATFDAVYGEFCTPKKTNAP